MANGSEVLGVQKTITPGSVWTGVAVLNLLVWAICAMISGSPVWSAFLALFALGVATLSGLIAVDVVDWHGVLLFNPWKKSRRVLFSGLNLKLPWEKVEEDGSGNIVLTSLVRTISSKETKGHPTNDPAEVVETSLLIHIRVNSSGTPGEPLAPQEAADNFIKFRSIKEEALTEIVRVEVEKMFAEYYGGQEMETLLKPHVIQEAVIGTAAIENVVQDTNETNEEFKKREELRNKDEKNRKKNVDMKEKMEKNYGVSIGVVLESSKPDKATQDMKRTPAIAEALATAMQKLELTVKDPDMRRRIAMILDPNTDYSEERFDLHVDAPDLKNLKHASFMGFGDKGKGGKK